MEKQYEHLLVRNDILKNGGPTDLRTADQALQRQYNIVVEEDLTLREIINELENKIKVLEEVSATKVKKDSDKDLTEHELVLQKNLK